MLENNISRIMIEVILKKALRDIKDSPERSFRNLVDLALYFSKNRFQRSFFEATQVLLKNENSAYYGLLRDVAMHVDPEKILRFGMNIGYNSCTAGAKKNREIEEREHYNIPWVISFHLRPQQYLTYEEEYHRAIFQGEELGIYTWILFHQDPLDEILSLPREHPNSAFILFCEPQDIDSTFLDEVAALNNLMPVLRYDENFLETFDLMRKKELLYSLYSVYHNSNITSILNDDFLQNTEHLHPVFTVFLADIDCSDPIKREMHEYVKSARMKQQFQTIPWEYEADLRLVDSIISKESCYVGFDFEGRLYTPNMYQPKGHFNLFQNHLSEILKGAYLKAPIGRTS